MPSVDNWSSVSTGVTAEHVPPETAFFQLFLGCRATEGKPRGKLWFDMVFFGRQQGFFLPRARPFRRLVPSRGDGDGDSGGEGVCPGGGGGHRHRPRFAGTGAAKKMHSGRRSSGFGDGLSCPIHPAFICSISA